MFSIALVSMLSGSIHCGAQEKPIETLDTAAVVGQPEKAKPQAGGFNPMHGRYWLGGYKKSFTSGIPEELRNVEAVTAEPVAIVHRVEASRWPLSTDDNLTRARKLGRLVACADVWYYPFSERIAKGGNSRIDFDILQAIASRQDWRVEVVWANTGSFGGIGREFRRGIDKGYCDFFTGLLVTGNDYLIEKYKLTLTRRMACPQPGSSARVRSGMRPEFSSVMNIGSCLSLLRTK